MVGRDQSANLSGMLGQIAETTGSMGDAYKPVMQAAMKPKGDMNDPEHLQRLAQWASSNGDPQQASMYMTQARQRSAEMKEAAKVEKQENAMKAANTSTMAYKAALESADPDKISEAEKDMLAAAEIHGFDAMARMNGAGSFVRQQNDQAFQESEQKRVAEEREAQAKLTQQFNAVTDVADIQAVVDSAPENVAAEAQRMATARLSYLNQQEKREAYEREKTSEVYTEFTVPEGLPTEVADTLKAEHARLESLAEKGKNADGTWKDGAKRAVSQGMTKLADRAYSASVQTAVAEENDTRIRLRDVDRRRANISTQFPTKAQTEAIQKQMQEEGTVEDAYLGFIDSTPTVSYSEVVARFRADQNESLDQEVNSIRGETPEPTEDEEDGTDPNKRVTL